MRNWISRFSIHKIRTQMLISMIAMVIVSSGYQTFFVVRQTMHQTEETYISIQRSNLQTYNTLLTLKIDSIVSYLRKTVYEEDFLELIKSPDSKAIAVNKLKSFIAQERMITGAAIYDCYGNYVNYTWYSTPSIREAYNQYAELHPIETTEWYSIAIEANGKECLYGYNIFHPEANDISCVKLIKDPQTGEKLGMMVITVDKELLNSIIDDSDDYYQPYTLLIADEKKDDYLIFSSSEDAEKDLFSVYRKERDQELLNKGDYIFMACNNRITGWSLIVTISKKDLNAVSSYLFPSAMYILFFSVLAAVFFSLLISTYINRPLEKLKRAINKFNEDHQLITETFDMQEIGQVSTFLKEAVNNNIVLNQKIIALNNQNREMEFRALQSQINPHFLYNTLDALYMMAVIHRVDEIANMTAALSEMFKLTLNKGHYYIFLSEELAYIRSYILIQNMRFSGKITLDEHVAEDIDPEQCCMLKFLIQPFIENAVYHGLEPKIGKSMIELNIQRNNQDLEITICDNGIGIPDMSVIRQGYGIHNVEERLSLFYGKNYHVAIESSVGKGTTVKLAIPILTKDELLKWNILESS